MTLHRSAAIAALLAFFLSSLPPAWSAGPEDCAAVWSDVGGEADARKIPLPPAPTRRSLGKVGIRGGVKHTPVRNQRCGEICWSYGETGLAEAQHLALTGEHVHLSPEYNAFWHIYTQMKHHLGYFTEMNKKIAALPKDQQGAEIKRLIDEVYGLLRERKHMPGNRLWQPQMGSDETIALKEATVAGFVPEERFNAPIRTDAQENQLEAAVKKFIGKNLLDPKKLKSFEGNDKDGINTPLYKTLVRELKRPLGGTPLRPDEAFMYRGQTFTARTLMTDYMKFDPASYTNIGTNKDTVDLALKAIVRTLEGDGKGVNGRPVPIGIMIAGDTLTPGGPNAQEFAQLSGIFSSTYCPGGVCKVMAGGHEVLVVNYLRDEKGEITALIVKNSWGNQFGRDVNGELTQDPSKRGYWIIPVDYLKQTFGGRELFNMTIPKEVADLKEFQPLSAK